MGCSWDDEATKEVADRCGTEMMMFHTWGASLPLLLGLAPGPAWESEGGGWLSVITRFETHWEVSVGRSWEVLAWRGWGRGRAERLRASVKRLGRGSVKRLRASVKRLVRGSAKRLRRAGGKRLRRCLQCFCEEHFYFMNMTTFALCVMCCFGPWPNSIEIIVFNCKWNRTLSSVREANKHTRIDTIFFVMDAHLEGWRLGSLKTVNLISLDSSTSFCNASA